jgi:hypothetical protein
VRYLLPLTLASVAALSVSGCAGPNLQGYHIVRTSDPSAADSICRLLADPRDSVRRFCVDAAKWEQYDKWAASAGVTCQKIPGPGQYQLQDACLTAGLWRRFNYARLSATAGPGWNGGNPGGSDTGTTTFNPVDLPQPYATSYGPFPSGGAIGQSFR